MNDLPPALLPVLALAVLALLPVLVSWLVVVVPSRRREATGMLVGNPLHTAPLAEHQMIIAQPLVSLSRQLGSTDMGGYLLGLRHVPVEKSAPLLSRYVRCADPALQLYAQSILAQGREQLQMRLVKLQKAPADDSRSAAWLLETGLTLASPTLAGVAERPGFLQHLASLARDRLQSCAACPSLLANSARVFLEAGHPSDARSLVEQLPAGSPLRLSLEPAVAHALHQQSLA